MAETNRIADPLITELEQEGEATRRMLERVPDDQLQWRPHEKSMTLGQLALHLASLQGAIAGFLETESLDVADVDFTPPQPRSKRDILDAFAESIALARAGLGALSNDAAAQEWRLTNGEREVLALPKAALTRTLLLNHAYHHRGQLSVYLRLLDVPVPATYGASAEESQLG